MIAMWEGYLKHGLPYGFIRFIQGFYTQEMFIGSLSDFDTTMRGFGVYVVDDNEEYSGLYDEDSKYKEDEPEESAITVIETINCPKYEY